jgi:alpha-tubulin suppressor-like RCC1 family protein
MLLQLKKQIATLTLAEPDITGRTHPILPSGEWGINRAAALGVFPDHGLQVYLSPWTTKNKADLVVLRKGSVEVDRYTVRDQSEFDQRATLFIAPRHLTSGPHEIDYWVKRLGLDPAETYTPPLKIFVKLEIPGGQDTEEGPGHSNLYMFIPPEFVSGGVHSENIPKDPDYPDDPEAPKAGVPIVIRHASGSGKPYLNIAVDDKIQVSWGGILFWSDPVTAEQINDPVKNPITIYVKLSTIKKAGDTDTVGLAVSFRVRDIVHNYSEDWCKETRIRVSLNTDRLVAPIVKNAINNVLDLDLPDNKKIVAQVWVNTTEFEDKDEIEVKVSGTTADGKAVTFTALKQKVDNRPHVYEFDFENADLRSLVATQVIFSYEVKREGKPLPLYSKGQFVQVNGEATRLDAPVAEDENQGAIDPDLPRTRILIRANPLFKHGDAFELVWFGKRPEGSIYVPEFERYPPSREEIADPIGFFLTVDGSHLQAIKGGTLVLSYVHLSVDGNDEIVRRVSLPAAPLNVGEPEFELVKPIVLGENNGSLEPADLPNGVGRLTVPKPIVTPTKSGDKVTYEWEGEQSGKTGDSIDITALNANSDVPFRLSETFVAEHIEPNRGARITAKYKIWHKETDTFSYSNPLEFSVGESRQLLDQARVVQALDDILDPANVPDGATVEIPANDPENAGDHFYMTWASSDGQVEHTDDKAVSGNNKGKPIEFTVDLSVVQASLNKKVTVGYWVELFDGGEAKGKPYVFDVQAQEFQLPVATFREATGSQKDQLNPDDVYPNGATVVIPATAQLKTDDEITVIVVGKDTTPYTHKVLATEAGKEFSVIKAAHAVISANLDNSISLRYEIQRKAGGTDGPSKPTVYDVRRVIGSGSLKVMGARYNRSTYRASGATRVLSAFNATTGQPLQAQWKYASDTEWVTAATWRDTSPQQPLQVRTADDLVTLNSANIIGNGIDTAVIGQAAFVAHRDVGDVIGWGNELFGALIPSSVITMDDIVEVSCTRSAYAARRANTAVVAWGNADEGGTMTGIDPLGFVEVIGNSTAFAGLKDTGKVVAWGIAADGGSVPEDIGKYTDIVQVIAAGQAFAAKRKDGTVVAWGLATHGGLVTEPIKGFTDIENVIGSFGAFAAHRGNGRIVGWGSEAHGGEVSQEVALMTDIIELSCANAQAFTARRATGQVVAWGTKEYGGVVDSVIGGFTDIVEVSSTWRAFAARRGNGHVVAWGTEEEGGAVPGNISRMDDIVQVCGSSMAFAALRKDGTVVVWGNKTVGGDISAVESELTQVQALYDNTHGFTALTADGRVVTWGHPAGGGDSSASQEELRGKVSYHATPTSRGRALLASRWALLNDGR